MNFVRSPQGTAGSVNGKFSPFHNSSWAGDTWSTYPITLEWLITEDSLVLAREWVRVLLWASGKSPRPGVAEQGCYCKAIGATMGHGVPHPDHLSTQKLAYCSTPSDPSKCAPLRCYITIDHSNSQHSLRTIKFRLLLLHLHDPRERGFFIISLTRLL